MNGDPEMKRPVEDKPHIFANQEPGYWRGLLLMWAWNSDGDERIIASGWTLRELQASLRRGHYYFYLDGWKRGGE
jgi:hypothetical protein